MAVLPDGLLVSGSDDATIRIWNVERDECLQTLEGHDGVSFVIDLFFELLFDCNTFLHVNCRVLLPWLFLVMVYLFLDLGMEQFVFGMLRVVNVCRHWKITME